MLVKAAILWIIGLVTLAPYGTYYLLFEAPREQYALWITLILFWIFGYWSFVGPLLLAIKVRSVLRLLQSAGSKEDLQRALTSPEARDAAVALIAQENHIPRFIASRVFDLLIRRMSQSAQPRESLNEPGTAK